MGKSKRENIKDFLIVAKEFCHTVDQRSKISRIQFFQALYPSIAALLKFGSEITGYEYLKISKNNLDEDSKKWKVLYSSLGKKFGKYNQYREIFDPYDSGEKEAIYGSLADDIADIYGDIKPGLEIWSKASTKIRLQIISNWRFQYEIHWGEHGTSALRALYFILFRIVDARNGLPVGLHKKEDQKG